MKIQRDDDKKDFVVSIRSEYGKVEYRCKSVLGAIRLVAWLRNPYKGLEQLDSHVN